MINIGDGNFGKKATGSPPQCVRPNHNPQSHWILHKLLQGDQLCQTLNLPKNVSGCIFWVCDSNQPHVHAGLGCTLCPGQNWKLICLGKKTVLHKCTLTFWQPPAIFRWTRTCRGQRTSRWWTSGWSSSRHSPSTLKLWKPHIGELWPTSNSLHQDGRRLVDLQPHHPLRPHRHPHIHGHPSPVSWTCPQNQNNEFNFSTFLPTFLNFLWEIF